MNSANDFWNDLAPDAPEGGDQIGDEPWSEAGTDYEGRHRIAGVLDNLDERTTQWLALIDYASELRTICIERGLSEALSESLVETFVRTLASHPEADR